MLPQASTKDNRSKADSGKIPSNINNNSKIKNTSDQALNQPQQQHKQKKSRTRSKMGKNKNKNKENDLANQLPNLMLAKSEDYNLLKKIQAIFYGNSNNHSLYHVWLDCMYDVNVTLNDVLNELSPLLNTSKMRDSLQMNHIYIIGEKLEDGSIAPAGSCFILLNHLVSKPRVGSTSFEQDILKTKLKMIQVDIAMLRCQLKKHSTLLFTKSFRSLLPGVTNATINRSGQTKSKLEPLQPKDKVIVKNNCQKPAQPKVLSTDIEVPPSRLVIDEERYVPKPPLNVKQEAGLSEPMPAIFENITPLTDFMKEYERKLKVLSSWFNKESDNIDNGCDKGNFEMNLRTKLETDFKRSTFVTKILQKLQEFGNAVIRIDNLPAKLTVNALNLMMGTYTITHDQVVMMMLPSFMGHAIMSIRIVLPSNNPDIKSILSKDKYKTAFDTILQIKLTSFAELESFLSKNYDKIRQLETNERLPIGYSRCCS